jgi:nucleotide-binding universal stress UspA family protein
MSARPIIVGIDPQREDDAPATLAARLARAYDAPVVAIAVLARHAADNGTADAALARARRHLPAGSLTHAVTGDSPAHALRSSVAAHQASLLVIGSAHGGPIGHLRSGHVAERVLHDARCPVAIAPHGYVAPAAGLRRIGVAFVDTAEGREALEGAAALAAGARAALEVTTVVEWFDATGMVEPPAELIDHEHAQATELAQLAAQRALSVAPHRVPADVTVVAGGTTARLVERSAGLDLLVCGSRGHGAIRAMLEGSVSHALAHHAHCPLIVVSRGTEPVLAALASER